MDHPSSSPQDKGEDSGQFAGTNVLEVPQSIDSDEVSAFTMSFVRRARATLPSSETGSDDSTLTTVNEGVHPLECDERTLSLPGSVQRNSISPSLSSIISKRFLCTLGWIAILSVATSGVSYRMKQHRGAPSSLCVSMTRKEQVASCIQSMGIDESGADDTLKNARLVAKNWFLEGAGKNLDIMFNSTQNEARNRCVEKCIPEFESLFGLVVLRETANVNEASWHTSRPFSMPSDVCRWTRISCSTDGHIEGLVFNNAGLNGTLPPDMCGMSARLTSLEVYTNPNLVGTIPSEIGRMTALEKLYLQHSGLEGSMPSELGQLTLLEQLLFDNTNVTGVIPKEVCNLFSTGSLRSLRGTCGGAFLCSCCTSCKQPDFVAVENL